VAQLRRGMIVTASVLGNWDDAVDQYIELINAYPGDTGLIQEAALAAGAHGRREKLLGFYRNTVANSPRDARWSVVLAGLEMALEDYPAAIEAYGKAIKIRPEQKDLYQSRAELSERQYKLDDAVADYERLYALSYHDPQWMIKEAEAQARQGRDAAAVKALETAWISGHPATAASCFQVATKLEQWGILEEARRYAERGIDLAGADLLTDSANQSGAEVYARIMARLRQSDAAFTRLALARQQAEKLPLMAVAEQVAKDGLGAVTSEEWRKRRVEERTKEATQGFAQALQSMAAAVGEYATPEEKTQFAEWLQTKRASAIDGSELRAVYLPAIRAAGLTEMEAQLLWEFIEKSTNPGGAELNDWVALQQRRVQLEGAGAKIEALAASTMPRLREPVLLKAEEVYRTEGDDAGELRVMDKLAAAGYERGGDQQRYFELLLAVRPNEMVARASNNDAAAQFLMAHGKVNQAFAGITARSRSMPAVWKKAYTGLTGLYLREHRPEVRTAFDSALAGEVSIGERIAHPVNRSEQLAGEVWFYYGSRYGEYLDQEKNPQAEDYLEAELEHTPAHADAYLELADYSAEAGRTELALVDYRHSIDLKKDQPAAWKSIAELEWKQGRKEDAIAAWQQAVKLLAAEMDARHVPESFWGDFGLVLASASAHGEYAAIDQDVEAMLRVYLARNGNYEAGPLLKAGYEAHGNSLEWLFAIVMAAKDPADLLATIDTEKWVARKLKSRLLGKIVELRRRSSEAAQGRFNYSLQNSESEWIDALLDEKNFAEARTELTRILADKRESSSWLRAQLRLAEADATLPRMTVEWKKNPSTAPSQQELRSAASALSAPSKRIVMRFVYERALEARELVATNFLGLAAIDLDEGDLTSAVELLKRLTRVSSNAYADTDAASSLLEERGHFSEAIQFLQPLAGAFPWNASYKTRLAVAELAGNAQSQRALNALAAVAADPKAKYAERVVAGRALQGRAVQTASGSTELDLLERKGCPGATEADRPHFVEARMAAAACSTDNKERESLLHSALATAPGNSVLRVQYLFAAFQEGFDARGLVAAEPILETGQYYGDYYSQEEDSVSDDSESALGYSAEDESVSSEESAGRQKAVSLASMKPEEASKLIWFAIHAQEKRHENDKALSLARRGRNLDRDQARRSALEKESKRLQTELARERENAARAPKIHNELEQDRVVRPRLLPGMAFVPGKAASDEEDAE